ncbi:MAG: S8 family serine peptidase, partial [Anaerolineae bacterium]|nr:S8 family serine peptidase [Anaerolineae bacterium]
GEIALLGLSASGLHPRAEGILTQDAQTVLVRMRHSMSREEVADRLAPHGVRIVGRIPQIDIWIVKDTRSMQVRSPLTTLTQDREVLWAEPDGRVHVAGITPNDNFYQAQQWNLRLIGLPEAWVFTRGSTGPIAVIDTGVDLDHPDLAGKLWTNAGEIESNGVDDDGNGYTDDVHGWDFVSSDGLPDDDHGHGSHVAGIAAAQTDNGAGVAGVAWESPIMPLRVLNSSGEGGWADVLMAMVYAADNGASVLNLSLGQEPGDPQNPVPVQAVQATISYVQAGGCLVLAAAGNNDSQPAPVMYPAASPGVVAVAATTQSDGAWDRSNRGPEVDVAAPGVSIFSTTKNGGYTWLSGTSMATPHVSGLAALLWSLDPGLKADQVTHVITSTAHDVHTPGWDERTGWGRIDAQVAVFQLAQPEVALVAEPPSVLVGKETASITATVTYSQSQPAPDGLSVTFTSSLGRVNPQSDTTTDGGVTATFSSTSGFGEALVVASVLGNPAGSTTIEVVPYRIYCPVFWP